MIRVDELLMSPPLEICPCGEDGEMVRNGHDIFLGIFTNKHGEVISRPLAHITDAFAVGVSPVIGSDLFVPYRLVRLVDEEDTPVAVDRFDPVFLLTDAFFFDGAYIFQLRPFPKDAVERLSRAKVRGDMNDMREAFCLLLQCSAGSTRLLPSRICDGSAEV